MPELMLRPQQKLTYEDNWLGAPWLADTAEAVLLIHGVAETSRAWTGWVPHLAAHLRVLRPDLPGFAGSTAPPAPYAWTPDEVAADLALFLARLGVSRVHVVGAKYGGTIAMQFAAEYPARTLSLSVVSSPAKGHSRKADEADIAAFPAIMRTHGVRHWADVTQRTRLGSEATDAQLAWWTDELMGRQELRASSTASAAVALMDVTPVLPNIAAPTLVITTEGSGLQGVDTVRDYQRLIPGSRLLVLPGDCYHVAAVRPDDCAGHVLQFIRSL